MHRNYLQGLVRSSQKAIRRPHCAHCVLHIALIVCSLFVHQAGVHQMCPVSPQWGTASWGMVCCLNMHLLWGWVGVFYSFMGRTIPAVGKNEWDTQCICFIILLKGVFVMFRRMLGGCKCFQTQHSAGPIKPNLRYSVQVRCMAYHSVTRSPTDRRDTVRPAIAAQGESFGLTVFVLYHLLATSPCQHDGHDCGWLSPMQEALAMIKREGTNREEGPDSDGDRFDVVEFLVYVQPG